jgi:hypothetical protein
MYFSPIQVLQGVSNIDNGCASYLATPNLVVSFPQIGTYYFIIGNVQIADFKYLVDSNIVINMMCLDSCGDGIKQGTEQCDNGNITGCLNCIVDSYYSCGGNITANSCLCAIPNTRYNHTTLQCELDCLFIPFSTGILDRSTNTCGCLPGFYFNVICKINCSLIIGAIGSVTGSTSTCKCNSPRFYFDLLNFVCRINCSRIAGAIGSVFSSSTLCQCQSTFIFDPLNFVCRINCSLIARAIGSVVGSLTLC